MKVYDKYTHNNNQSLGISLDERKSRAYQVVHPMLLWGEKYV